MEVSRDVLLNELNKWTINSKEAHKHMDLSGVMGIAQKRSIRYIMIH